MFEQRGRMTVTDEFLEHYGVKGQKWGVRRTPEQLGHRGASVIKRLVKKWKKSSEKKKKKQVKVKQESEDEIRQKVLKSVDPKYIYKHRALLDDKELQGRIDRINKETTLKKLAQPEDQAYKVAKKGDNWLRTTANMANSVKDIYTAMNVISSIAQKGVNKSESSTVNINVGGKKDKKKDKKDDNK